MMAVWLWAHGSFALSLLPLRLPLLFSSYPQRPAQNSYHASAYLLNAFCKGLIQGHAEDSRRIHSHLGRVGRW
jgi:hypothetical protein